MAIFASREQLCIKKEFSQLKGREKVQACGKAVKLNRKITEKNSLNVLMGNRHKFTKVKEEKRKKRKL